MINKIASLVTEDGHWLPVKRRTAAVMAEVYAFQDRIEASQQGEVEITIYFRNSTIKVSVRDVSEPRKVD